MWSDTEIKYKQSEKEREREASAYFNTKLTRKKQQQQLQQQQRGTRADAKSEDVFENRVQFSALPGMLQPARCGQQSGRLRGVIIRNYINMIYAY